MTKAPPLTGRAIIPVMVGSHCRGHLLNRGPRGWQAIDPDDGDHGTFQTIDAAAAALVAEGAA